MARKKTQQQYLEGIRDAAEKDNQSRMQKLLQGFRKVIKSNVLPAPEPDKINEFLDEIESERVFDPATVAEIEETRRFVEGVSEEGEEFEVRTRMEGEKEAKEEEKEEILIIDILADDFLQFIFGLETTDEEKIKELNNQGFGIKSVPQLIRIVQETVYELFKKVIATEEGLDGDVILDVINAQSNPQKALDKFKVALKDALPKKTTEKKGAEPAPKKPQKKKVPVEVIPAAPPEEKPSTKTFTKEALDELRAEAKEPTVEPPPPPTGTLPKEELEKLREKAAAVEAVPEAPPEEEPGKGFPVPPPILEEEPEEPEEMLEPEPEEPIEEVPPEEEIPLVPDEEVTEIIPPPEEKPPFAEAPEAPAPEGKPAEEVVAEKIEEEVSPLQALDNKIKEHPELEFIIHLLTGNIKAVKEKGFDITRRQLKDFMREDKLSGIDSFKEFVRNRKSALQLLLDNEEGGPYEPEGLDGLLDVLEEMLQGYIQEVHDLEKRKLLRRISFDMYEIMKPLLMIRDTGLGEIQDELKKERLEDIQRVIQDVFDSISLEDLRDIQGTIYTDEKKEEKLKPIREGLKKLRNDIQTVLEEEGLLELLPVDVQKMLKKEIPEEKAAEEKPPKPPETVAEKLDKMARKIAPAEYREWSDLFEVLHYSAPPRDKKHRTQIMNKRMRLLGTKTGEEHRLLRNALRTTELRAFIDANNPISALQAVFLKEKLSEENLAEKLREKIDEIKKMVREKKAEVLKPPIPDNKGLRNVLEKNKETRELINTLDFIRQGFKEYDSAKIIPRGFKDDLDELNKVFKKRQEKDDPLVKAESREELIIAYIELLKPRKPELFKEWNEEKFLKEMAGSLNRVANIHKKLLLKT